MCIWIENCIDENLSFIISEHQNLKNATNIDLELFQSFAATH